MPASADRPYVALVPREPAVRLPDVGDTATITVEAASDRPVEPWQISVVDLAEHHGHEPCIAASFSQSTVDTGDTPRLTLTLVRKDPHDLCLAGLVSTLGDSRHLWPLTIVIR